MAARVMPTTSIDWAAWTNGWRPRIIGSRPEPNSSASLRQASRTAPATDRQHDRRTDDADQPSPRGLGDEECEADDQHGDDGRVVVAAVDDLVGAHPAGHEQHRNREAAGGDDEHDDGVAATRRAARPERDLARGRDDRWPPGRAPTSRTPRCRWWSPAGTRPDRPARSGSFRAIPGGRWRRRSSSSSTVCPTGGRTRTRRTAFTATIAATVAALTATAACGVIRRCTASATATPIVTKASGSIRLWVPNASAAPVPASTPRPIVGESPNRRRASSVAGNSTATSDSDHTNSVVKRAAGASARMAAIAAATHGPSGRQLAHDQDEQPRGDAAEDGVDGECRVQHDHRIVREPVHR